MAKTVKVLVNGVVRQMSEKGAKMAERFYGATRMDEKVIAPPVVFAPLIEPPKILLPEKKEAVVVEAKVKKTGEAVVKIAPAEEKVVIPKKKRNVPANKQKNK